jgi:hypothetical protein
MNGTPPVPPPPGMPPAMPPKTGMSPLAWIGIGCVVILIFCGIALGVMGFFIKKGVDKFAKNPGMATAELVVKANPDLELVSADDKTNTLTVKDKKTGEVTTFSADDIKNGSGPKFTVKTDKGTATFDASDGKGMTMKATDDKGQVTTFNAGTNTPQNLPSWLPAYPGGTVQGTSDMNNNEGRTAAFTVATKDSTDKMLEFYDTQLKSAGLKTEKSTFTSNGQTGGTVTGKSDDGKRVANVIVSSSAEGTQAVVTFNEKK